MPYTDRQPKSGAFAHVFGGEKRIEYLPEMIGRDAGAVVFKVNLQLVVANHPIVIGIVTNESPLR